MMRPVVLLGPQRRHAMVRQVLDALGIDGPIAAVTAGWQEREAELDELREHVRQKIVHLELYERADNVFDRDPDLFEAYRYRQDRLKALQELYRFRLRFSLEMARDLMHREGDSELIGPERAAAVTALRALDTHHLRRVSRLQEAFVAEWTPSNRSSVITHRRDLERLLKETQALVIAGGHVAILLNRLRLFDVPPMAGEKPIVAWSAGAMVLAERVVLFHDSPPQGPGNAEVLDAGLGLARGVLALPDARRRLRLEDRVRVALFARRFHPAACWALDEGGCLRFDGTQWIGTPESQRLTRTGRLACGDGS